MVVTVVPPPPPTHVVPPAALVSVCIEAVQALEADAALLEQHLGRAVEARTAMHKAQLGKLVPEGEAIPSPHEASLGALKRLLEEHHSLAERLRLATVRAFDCEHVHVVRGAP